jgi:hypothetical protein
MDRSESKAFFLLFIFTGVYLMAFVYQKELNSERVKELKQDIISNTVKDLLTAPIVIGPKPEAKSQELGNSKCPSNSYMHFYGLLICKGEDCCKHCMEKPYPSNTRCQSSLNAMIFVNYCLNVEALKYFPEMMEFIKKERQWKAQREEDAKERHTDDGVMLF